MKWIWIFLNGELSFSEKEKEQKFMSELYSILVCKICACIIILKLLKYWMYLILQLEDNYRSTTNILKSSAIISDFKDSIISINCCFKSISKSPSCSSDNHRTRNTSQTDHQIIKEQRSGYKDQNFHFLMWTVFKFSITYDTEFPDKCSVNFFVMYLNF